MPSVGWVLFNRSLKKKKKNGVTNTWCYEKWCYETQNETENSYQKCITKCDRGLLQSASGIAKCDRLLLQSASGITKCDSLLLQSASGITKCDSTKSQTECFRYLQTVSIFSRAFFRFRFKLYLTKKRTSNCNTNTFTLKSPYTL